MKMFSLFTVILRDGSFHRSLLRMAALRMSTVTILVFVCLGMQAQTKSVSVLGDSYSTFEGFITPRANYTWYHAAPDYKNTDVSSVRQTWWHKVVRNNGWRLCVNNSFSGSTISFRGYHGSDYRDRSFIARMDNLGCPDIIFIFGGTNDSWAGVPVGEYKYEGISEADLYTFRPAMAYMLAYIKDRYPNTEIYFLLNDGLRDDISSSAEAICEHEGVPCIELKGIDKKSGHPTIKGHGQIAEQVSKAIRKDR